MPCDALFGEGEERGRVLAVGAGVPQADRAGVVERRDRVAGRAECHGVDGVGVIQDPQWPAGVRVPDADGVVDAGGGEKLAVGGVAEVLDLA